MADLTLLLFNTYLSFIRRDLNYIVGGGVFIFVVLFNTDQLVFIVNLIFYNVFSFLFFVIIVYFIGIIIHEGMINVDKLDRILGVHKHEKSINGNKDEKIKSRYYPSERRLMDDLHVKYPVLAGKLERTIFFKEVGSKIGWPLIFSLLFNVIYYSYHSFKDCNLNLFFCNHVIIQVIVIIILVVLCFVINKKKLKEQHKIINDAMNLLYG